MAKPNRLARHIAIITGIILAVFLGVFYYSNRIFISDLISSAAFTPSEQITDITARLDLTDRAKTMLFATHPALSSRDDFSAHCNPDQDDISVLGCYTNGKIYLFDIKEDDLSGIIESTTAHELLHAAWERLDAPTKNKISAELTAVYNDSKYHDLLAEDLSIYDDSERIDELHSRVGTEITDLPSSLETYYARYFKNQDQIVKYYDGYIAPFRELSAEIDSLTAKLDDLNATIDADTKSYYKSAEDLSKEVDDFNSCAAKSGCFATESAFYAKMNELLDKQAALDQAYDSLDQKINDYNKLVEEYNDNIIRSKDLENAINSNSKVEKVN